MVKKFALLWLSMTTGCFAGKQFKGASVMPYIGEVYMRYGQEVVRLQPVVAQKYYHKALAELKTEAAEAIARDSFGESWQTEIQVQFERHNPEVAFESLLFKSLVWVMAKRAIAGKLLRNAPVAYHAFFDETQIKDTDFDSEAEEDSADSPIEEFSPRSN